MRAAGSVGQLQHATITISSSSRGGTDPAPACLDAAGDAWSDASRGSRGQRRGGSRGGRSSTTRRRQRRQQQQRRPDSGHNGARLGCFGSVTTSPRQRALQQQQHNGRRGLCLHSGCAAGACVCRATAVQRPAVNGAGGGRAGRAVGVAAAAPGAARAALWRCRQPRMCGQGWRPTVSGACRL